MNGRIPAEEPSKFQDMNILGEPCNWCYIKTIKKTIKMIKLKNDYKNLIGVLVMF